MKFIILLEFNKILWSILKASWLKEATRCPRIMKFLNTEYTISGIDAVFIEIHAFTKPPYGCSVKILKNFFLVIR